MKSEVFNIDCLVGMKEFTDKYFDLAVVDPVFGDQVKQGGYMENSSSKLAKNILYNNALWKQEKTDSLYFSELKRISKNQIIWGGNYFTEEIRKNSSCWIVWDKDNGDNDFADCELAWTSFDTATRKFKFKWKGMLQQDMKNKEIKIHPTQKPVALYDWIYKNYLPSGGKVIDTHLGSGSNRISADKAGNIDFTAYELDKDYFDAQEKRFKQYKSQTRLELV